MPASETPIRVFVGSGLAHEVEETVFAHSLLRHASRPVEIDIIDGARHGLRRFGSRETRPLPEAWRGLLSGATVYSFARFAPPELCGYEGRALYCEADQLVLGDIGELFEQPLGGAALAAVPYEAIRGHVPSWQGEGHLSSVMVFDAARCRSLSASGIAADVRSGRLAYRDAISLTARCREALGIDVAPLPARWNDLERRFDDTRLLHFTEKRWQPWCAPGHPESAVWIQAYLDCVERGLLQDEQLERAWRRGSISRRVRTLPRLPRRSAPAVDVLWQRWERLRHFARRRARALQRSGGRSRTSVR